MNYKRATIVLSAVCLCLMIGIAVMWASLSVPVTAGGAIGTVSIGDLKFKAMVIQYVQLDDKGTMGYTARLDYDVIDLNGVEIKSVSKNVVLTKGDTDWISAFVAGKTATAKTSLNVLTSDSIQ